MSESSISNKRFDWIPFYHDFAKALLPFRNNQETLIEYIKTAFGNAGIKVPTLDDDGTINHMDPFTVMGLFNKSGMKDDKRLHIISALAGIFHVNTPLPTRFDGIPVLYPLGATFYPFQEKKNGSLFNLLWDLLETALQYAEDKDSSLLPQLKDLITRTIEIKYNGNSKITMSLYWISPETFINLDSRNEWYIYESGKIPMEMVHFLPPIHGESLTGERYFEILESVKSLLPQLGFNGFPELSHEAWRYSEQVNEEERRKKPTSEPQGGVGPGLGDINVRTTHYWLYSPGVGAAQWNEFYQAGIMAIDWDGPAGDLTVYSSREDIRKKLQDHYGIDRSYKNDSLALWQFAKEIQPGDIIYAKKGMHKIVGRGVVTTAYTFNNSYTNYNNVRGVNWTNNGEWPYPGQAAMKVLTDITQYTDTVSSLETLFKEESVETSDPDVEDEPIQEYPRYTKEQFLNEVYMDESDLATLTGLLKKKKNIILQGAPGVGKTYAAKRIAYALMGEKNQDRVMMVQFHQSYSYEDFIEGFRPGSEGNQFVIKKGSFYQFCRKAADDLENDYYFIIDEINRGNMSRIFGELFMLIEADKRGNALQLLYSDEKFSVPGNVYIIGTMNTADRSLALLDYALRRRFAFYDMKPGFEAAGFRQYKEALGNAKFNKLIAQVKNLNEIIAKDDSLGEGFCIGHSYFCDLKDITDETLKDIVEYEIAPLLKEYWYDEKEKAEDAIAGLKDAIR